MSEQDSVLLLRRIEQAIYGLEKRLIEQRQPSDANPTRQPTEPPVVQFPTVMNVEVESGNINAIIEEQPIQTQTVLTTELVCAPVGVSLASAGTAALITVPSNATYQIYHITLVNNGALPVTLRIQDDNSIPNVYTGQMTLTPNAILTLSHIYPFIVLGSNLSLMVETTTAAELGGCIFYRTVDI